MITREDVLKMARLARLHLSEAEMMKTQERINLVLEHFQTLSEIPTDHVEPTYQGLDELVLRDDVAEEPLAVSDLEKNSPEFLEGSFKLPRAVGAVE